MSLSILEQIVVNNFPQNGLSLAFGYGSRVVRQGAASKNSDLFDIILAVDNPLAWHKSNLHTNRHHYSAVKYLPNSARVITKIQENYGAKIYFNPYVKVGDSSIKYGILKTSHLIDDLNEWTSLYVSGRLHKPVEFIVNTSDRNELLRTSMRRNKENAVRVALLLLPETFDVYKLYRTIANLSYAGDVRMLFGESKNKVDQIVTNQIERFNQLYLPLLKLSQTFKDSVLWDESRGIFVQDLSPQTVTRSLRALPRQLKVQLCQSYHKQAKTLDSDAILLAVSRNIHLDRIVFDALKRLVFKSTLPQTAKGLLTAGIMKSWNYATSKMKKSLSSRLNYN